MKNEKLQKLYDVVYEYTDIMNDDALNILDDVVAEFNVEHIADAFFDESEISPEDTELLAEAFIEAAARCADECY